MTVPAKVVLLVDDSPSIRRRLEFFLKPGGFRTLHAGDGLEALELLKAQPVDLAIVDLNMPRMDGIELTRTMRAEERTKSVPVIMLTTEAREVDSRLAREAGVNAYLTKPNELGVLLLHVRTLLGIVVEEPFGSVNPNPGRMLR